MANEVTAVEAEELLLRSIRDSDDYFVCDESGALLEVKISAFNDREKKPSVDRQMLREGAPESSKLNLSDGVVTLCAKEVRGVSPVIARDQDGHEISQHAVDVHHRPLENNYSHSQVECAPQIASGSAWKRLKEALCRIAVQRGWTCRPASSNKNAH